MKLSSIVTITGTGLPFSSPGRNRHFFAAHDAFDYFNALNFPIDWTPKVADRL
jgi:hypothetical protein